jgi:hypothetical protein
MIQINNLTQKQINMLNTMWSCDTALDIMNWQSRLNESDYKMSISLQDLLIAEYCDQLVLESDLAEANDLIESLKR